MGEQRRQIVRVKVSARRPRGPLWRTPRSGPPEERRRLHEVRVYFEAMKSKSTPQWSAEHLTRLGKGFDAWAAIAYTTREEVKANEKLRQRLIEKEKTFLARRYPRHGENAIDTMAEQNIENWLNSGY